MGTRDDFTQATKDLLAGRVGYLCARPECRAPTRGPNGDPRKATNVGTAAHITGAAPGNDRAPAGPRYDATLTPEERRAPENGIWLCRQCGTLVDADWPRFPAPLLREWKAEAEALAELVLGVPAPRTDGGPRPAPPSLGLEWFALADAAFAPVNALHPNDDFAWLRGRAFGPFVYHTDGSPTPYRVGHVDGEGLATARSKVAALVQAGLAGTTPVQYAIRAWALLYAAAPTIPSDRTGHLAGYAVELLEAAGGAAAEIEVVLAAWDPSASTVVATLGILSRTRRVAPPRFNAARETLADYAGRLLAAVGAPASQIGHTAEALPGSRAAQRVLAAAARALAAPDGASHGARHDAPTGALPPFPLKMRDQWALALIGVWDDRQSAPAVDQAFTAWALDPAIQQDPKRLYPVMRLIYRLGSGGYDPLTPEAEDPYPERASIGC